MFEQCPHCEKPWAKRRDLRPTSPEFLVNCDCGAWAHGENGQLHTCHPAGMNERLHGATLFWNGDGETCVQEENGGWDSKTPVHIIAPIDPRMSFDMMYRIVDREFPPMARDEQMFARCPRCDVNWKKAENSGRVECSCGMVATGINGFLCCWKDVALNLTIMWFNTGRCEAIRATTLKDIMAGHPIQIEWVNPKSPSFDHVLTMLTEKESADA